MDTKLTVRLPSVWWILD